MGRVVTNLELAGENIWEIHPSLALAGPFKDLYKSDKSPNKAHSSRLLWTVALIWDRDSKYYNLPETGEDSKIDLLFEDIYGDVKYYGKNRKKVEELRDFYLKLQETTARRSLREIEEKLDQRSKFLKDTMLADTKKIYDLYEQALRSVSNEVEESEAKGGAQESLSDKGSI